MRGGRSGAATGEANDRLMAGAPARFEVVLTEGAEQDLDRFAEYEYGVLIRVRTRRGSPEYGPPQAQARMTECGPPRRAEKPRRGDNPSAQGNALGENATDSHPAMKGRNTTRSTQSFAKILSHLVFRIAHLRRRDSIIFQNSGSRPRSTSSMSWPSTPQEDRFIRPDPLRGSPNRLRTSSLDSPPSVSNRCRDRARITLNFELMLSSILSASSSSPGTIVATTLPRSVSSNGSLQPGLTYALNAETSDNSIAFMIQSILADPQCIVLLDADGGLDDTPRFLLHRVEYSNIPQPQLPRSDLVRP